MLGGYGIVKICRIAGGEGLVELGEQRIGGGEDGAADQTDGDEENIIEKHEDDADDEGEEGEEKDWGAHGNLGNDER